MKISSLACIMLSLAATLSFSTVTSHATDGTWAVATGNWHAAGSWVDGTIGDGVGSMVDITNDGGTTSSRTITISSDNVTVGTLYIGRGATGGGDTLTASGGHYLLMNNGTSQAQIITPNTGTKVVSINTPIQITEYGLLIRNESTGALTVASTGQSLTTAGIYGTTALLTLNAASSANLNFYSELTGNIALLVDSSSTGNITLGYSGKTNTYTGGTTIRNGTVTISSSANDQVLGTGGITLGGVGSTNSVLLISRGDRTIANNLTISNATIGNSIGLQVGNNDKLTVTGNVDLQRNLELSKGGSGSREIVFTNSTISGAGSLSITGNNSPTVYLASAGTYTGGVNVTAKSTTLYLGHATALGTGTLTINDGNNTFKLDSSVGDLTLTPNNAIALSNNLTYVGTGGAHLNVGTGAVTLSGNRTIETQNGILTIGGVISGTANLTKTGAGILALNGANIYTGTTSVNGGTLRGTGSVLGAVSVANGATLEAGNSIGTFTAGGAVSFASGSTFKFELNSTLGTFDLLVAEGLQLTTNDTVTFSAADLGGGAWKGATSFVIINNTSGAAITGLFKDLAEGTMFNIGANQFEISYLGGTGNDVMLSYIIPEPGSVWLLAAAGVVLTLFRRRRA